jgi:hypothetical protein
MALNHKQAAKDLAVEKQKEALIKAPKFLTEYMVYFDHQNTEGPYNDVYLFSFIKHGLITPDTLIAEKGKKDTLRAGDCKDLDDFFSLFESEDKEDLLDDIQEFTEETGLQDNIPKKLLSLYFDNEDVFEEFDGADEALEHIHELSIDADKLNKKKDGMFFSIDDLEGYLKEDLSDRQNAIVENMVKETYRFLLHTKWDADLPAELIDLAVDVAELFDDPYTHVDYIILRKTYMGMKNKDIDTSDIAGRTNSVDSYVKKLLKRVVDGVEPNKEQKKAIQEIAQIQYNLENS